MKSILTLATVAAVMAVGAANAQTGQDSICEANYAANATIIAKAQAAVNKKERMKIINDAINSSSKENAACLFDLALQMSQNISPEAGPETFGGETPTTTDGNTPPAENPNQLNENSTTGSASPVTPAIVPAPSVPSVLPL